MNIQKEQNGMAFYNDVIFRFYRQYYKDKNQNLNKAYFNGLKQVIQAEEITMRKIQQARKKARNQ